MTTPEPDSTSTALGLERLRGELREGLARIEGALQLLVLRSEQSEKTSAEHADKLERHERRIDTLEAAAQVAANTNVDERLRQIEKKVCTICGVSAFVVAVAGVGVQLIH